jgi:ribonuclease P protein component
MEGLVLQVRKRIAQEARDELELDAVRVGFTVTKKVGNSVIRNRVRRRLRAVADKVLVDTAASGMDLVIIGRVGTIKRPYMALIKDLKTALKKLKVDKRTLRRD